MIPLYECPFWSQWTAGSCSKTCGAGKIIERRTCRKKDLESGKTIEISIQDCMAEFVDAPSERAIFCHKKECETQWSSWEKCERRCDGKTKQVIGKIIKIHVDALSLRV